MIVRFWSPSNQQNTHNSLVIVDIEKNSIQSLCWYNLESYCDNGTIRHVTSGRIGYRADQAWDNDAVHKDTATTNIEKDEPKNLNLQPAS